MQQPFVNSRAYRRACATLLAIKGHTARGTLDLRTTSLRREKKIHPTAILPRVILRCSSPTSKESRSCRELSRWEVIAFTVVFVLRLASRSIPDMSMRQVLQRNRHPVYAWTIQFVKEPRPWYAPSVRSKISTSRATWPAHCPNENRFHDVIARSETEIRIFLFSR